MLPRAVFLLLVLSALLAAQEPRPAATSSAGQSAEREEGSRDPEGSAPPRLRIEPAGKLDLGELGPRELRRQRYTFTNVSELPIALRVFELSPGVTVEGAALAGPIPAHASAGLTLTVDPTDWEGRQTRNVRLGTDDPRQGLYYLPTEMTVRPDLTVDRDRRDLGDVAAPGSAMAVFTFTRETGEPVVLRVAQALPPYLELEREEGRNAARLLLTLRTDRVAPGVLLGFERITVTTNAPLQPTFELYLSWKLHHRLEAKPSRVVFQERNHRTLEVSLRTVSGRPFRILSATVVGRGFQVSRPAARLAATQTLTLRRTARSPTRAMLVLHCSEEAGTLKVPLAFLP